MLTKQSLQLIVCSCLMLFFIVFASSAQQEPGTIDDLVTLKKQANTVLKQEIVPNTKVKAIQAGAELTEQNQEGAVVIKTTNYAGLKDFSSPADVYINFSGSKVTSEVPVIVTFKPITNITKKTTVDDNGAWSLSIPVSVLPAGNNFAFAQTEINGVMSDPAALASFTVSTQNEISLKTWYFIIFVTIAIITLLFAIIVQLRRNARDLDPGKLI